MDATFPSPPRPQRSTVLKHIRSLTFPFFSGQMWKNPHRVPSRISQQACTVRTETFPTSTLQTCSPQCSCPLMIHWRGEERRGGRRVHRAAPWGLLHPVSRKDKSEKKTTMKTRGLTRKTWRQTGSVVLLPVNLLLMQTTADSGERRQPSSKQL